ncbi:unnamed protein product, partial [Prorocentrum cordatum]
RLEKVTLLGSGNFGNVFLARNPSTRQLYALKRLSKGYVQSSGTAQQVCWERDLMTMLDSPFVVKLVSTYKDAQFVYLLMEAGGYMASEGGDASGRRRRVVRAASGQSDAGRSVEFLVGKCKAVLWARLVLDALVAKPETPDPSGQYEDVSRASLQGAVRNMARRAEQVARNHTYETPFGGENPYFTEPTFSEMNDIPVGAAPLIMEMSSVMDDIPPESSPKEEEALSETASIEEMKETESDPPSQSTITAERMCEADKAWAALLQDADQRDWIAMCLKIQQFPEFAPRVLVLKPYVLQGTQIVMNTPLEKDTHLREQLCQLEGHSRALQARAVALVDDPSVRKEAGQLLRDAESMVEETRRTVHEAKKKLTIARLRHQMVEDTFDAIVAADLEGLRVLVKRLAQL